MKQETELDSYMSSLRGHLGPMALGEREEILCEISAHIRDSVEQSNLTVEAVLERLGPPDELAAQYRDGLLIRIASQSASPVLLLRAAFAPCHEKRFRCRRLFCRRLRLRNRWRADLIRVCQVHFPRAYGRMVPGRRIHLLWNSAGGTAAARPRRSWLVVSSGRVDTGQSAHIAYNARNSELPAHLAASAGKDRCYPGCCVGPLTVAIRCDARNCAQSLRETETSALTIE